MAETAPEAEKRYVGIARTALGGESTIMKPLAREYVSKTVSELLEYMVEPKGLKEDEKVVARSIQKEMEREYTISANGKTVAPSAAVKNLFETRRHRGTEFEALELEIASVQEGGLVHYL